jgi:RNA polymerase sigma factor (sigma-70 family)
MTISNMLRDELVLSHLELAQRMAQIMHRTTLSHVDLEELESDAYLGLLEAASQFDPERNVLFRTYAAKRIHGQMIDGIREREHCRRKNAPLRMQSIDILVGGEGEHCSCLADMIPARDGPVGHEMETCDELRVVHRMVDALSSAREAHAQGYSVKGLALASGVTPSAISQRVRRFRKLAAEMDLSRN